MDFSEDSNGPCSIIINHYLEATQADAGKAGPLEVEINASVPKWNQQGRMRALRKISEMGKITYRVLGFEGDNAIKNQVIARYLQAEQQGQGDKSMSVTPDHYKFKLKGQRAVGNDGSVYVFQVTPRKKRIGLFKGEVWLDAKSYLPVVEKGRLVKNPSVFFRKVDFEREFAITNGVAVPAHMHSVIDTRLAGIVDLSVAYSSPAEADIQAEVAGDSSANPNFN